jgi:hypothetical protein
MCEKRMSEKINLDLHGIGACTSVIEIREGTALPQREPVKLEIVGQFDTIERVLKIRTPRLDQKQCHIIVDRDNRSIKLVIDETNPYAGSVTARLEYSKDWNDWGINSGKKFGLRELSDFIKMHRYCFIDKEKAMMLVNELRNFKANVHKQMEKTSDQRGNGKSVIEQIVDSNIPEMFSLNMMIFKGMRQYAFQVEVNIIVRDAEMECYLESAEANDIVNEISDKVIDGEVDKFRKIANDIVVIEK